MTSHPSFNPAPLASAWQAMGASETHFLSSWQEKTAKTKPLSGLKIYHNIPLSLETVCRIHALCTAGAEMVVSCPKLCAPATQPEAKALVTESGLEFRDEKWAEPGEFDVYLDYCAELADLPPPRLGTVELTRTGALIYDEKDVPYSVVSVDDSHLRALETFYSTGDGFIRAFYELTDKDPTDEIFALVGFGRVGQGIAHAIRDAGGWCIIFDTSADARALAASQDFEAHSCDSKRFTLHAIKDSSVVITATGRRHILESAFPNAPELLEGKTLCNMGAEDEIGSSFENCNVLAGGMPINFTLQKPTVMRYLDPVLHAHNLGIQILKDGNLGKGIIPFPEGIDSEILSEWSRR